MSTEWSKPTRYILAISLFLFGIFLLYIGRAVIPLIIIAALIAIVVSPFIRWLHYQARLPRGLAVLIVYLIVLILVPVALLLAIPAVVNAVKYVLSLDYQGFLLRTIDGLRATLTSIKETQIPFTGLDATIDQAIDSILAGLGSQVMAETPTLPTTGEIFGALGPALTTTFRTVAGLIGSVFTRITLVLFIFLISIHISLRAHNFRNSVLSIVPDRFQPELAILINRIVRVWNLFLRGQLTLMLIIGVCSWAGLSILGVSGALYLGIIAGLLELLPNLGPIIATIPAVFIALLEGSNYLPVTPPVLALFVILFYILLQQFENNLIVPKVLGEAVDLPALVVMTGVFVGAESAGLLGALLATPVIATGREIIRYIYLKIQGEDPFPPQHEMPKAAAGNPVFFKVWLENLSRLRRRPAPVKEERPEEPDRTGDQGS